MTLITWSWPALSYFCLLLSLLSLKFLSQFNYECYCELYKNVPCSLFLMNVFKHVKRLSRKFINGKEFSTKRWLVHRNKKNCKISTPERWSYHTFSWMEFIFHRCRNNIILWVGVCVCVSCYEHAIFFIAP